MKLIENPFNYRLILTEKDQEDALEHVIKRLPKICPGFFKTEADVVAWMSMGFEDAIRCYFNGLGIEIE